MNIFQCQPVEASWDPNIIPQRCIPLLTEFLCASPVNIITDLAILALPIPVITGMRLPHRQKSILVVTFALGVFVTVVDVVRIYYLQQAITFAPTGTVDDPSAIYGDNPEFSWNASLSLMWSAVEVNVGIMCACIPTLKPLIIRILPAMVLEEPERTLLTQAGKISSGGEVTTHTRGSIESQPAPPARTGLQSDSVWEPSAARIRGASKSEEDPTYDIGFLTTPDANQYPTVSNAMRSQLYRNHSAHHSAVGRDSSRYFGFVNIKKPKSMLRTSSAESFKYCTVVTVLVFLWGFSYGLLNTVCLSKLVLRLPRWKTLMCQVLI
jgi:hypothetical protein